MPKFKFIAIDESGRERRGMIEASSRSQADKQIRNYGMTPARVTPARIESTDTSSESGEGTRVKPMKKPLYFGSAVNKKALAEFTRKLATLLQAGLTLLRSLEVLVDQEKNPVFRWILIQICDSIQSGSTFSDALSKFPKEFDFLFVNMARAGEASGMLEVSLARLALYLEKTERMKARLAAAMTYPSVVMGISTLIVIGLLIFVVPSFEETFVDQLGPAAMPLLTVYVLGVSEYLLENWYVVFGSVVGFVILSRIFGKTPVGRSFFDWLKLRFLGFGELFTKIYVVRFCRTLGTLIESEVPILEALRITREGCGNVHVSGAVDKVRRKVTDGEGIASTLTSTRIFPTMVSSMIEVGEETGDLPDMLNQVADVYDEEVENSIASLTSIVQPLMIVLLAIVVVLIVLALFLPFVEIIRSLGAG